MSNMKKGTQLIQLKIVKGSPLELIVQFRATIKLLLTELILHHIVHLTPKNIPILTFNVYCNTSSIYCKVTQ